MASARRFSQHRILAALLLGLSAVPALANEGGAAEPAEEGRIIYARDVRHSVGDPHFPGPIHATPTAPTGTIAGAIALGLAPLTDSETSRITASLPQTAMNAAFASLATPAQGTASAQGGGLIGADSGGMAGGGAIGRAMGALTGALGSLSAIGGGRP